MNDLPQNELLTAYLDGELTAAERAEVEQLLANDPAARQLLDELRALSDTLHALPRKKLGEDLRRQVLRVAERRMLTGEESRESDDGSTMPVPLGRSIFRRFVNRRTMTWLGLTLAIAVIITINERQQVARHAADAPKEVAMAKSAQPRSGPVRPTTIQAAPDSVANFQTRSGASYGKKSEKSAVPRAPATAAPAGASGPESKPALEAMPAPAAKPAAQALGRTYALEKPADQSNAPIAGMPGPADRLKLAAEPAVDQAAEPAKADETVLLVRCNISPDAVRQQAFEKLLDANGVAWCQRPSGPVKKESGSEATSEIRPKTISRAAPVLLFQRATSREHATAELKEKPARDVKLSPTDQDWLGRDKETAEYGGRKGPTALVLMLGWDTAADKEALIDVEVTKTQLDATLAGLRAQPTMFPSFAVRPNMDAVRREQGASVPPAGTPQPSSQSQSQRSLSEATSVGAQQPSRQNLPPSAQQDLRQAPPSSQPAPQKQLPYQQSVKPPARQRVVFVLHLVGANHPAAAKALGEVHSSPSKPAEQTAPPANVPKQKE